MLGILAFAMGASVGSFLNVVADRVPVGRSVVTPRSFCETCNRPLTTWDLLPVISYLWLRGRCRYCGAVFPARLMVVESITGLLFTAVYLQYGLGVAFVIVGAAVSVLVAVARIDLEHGLILNSITYPSIGLLIIMAPFWNELDMPRGFLGNEDMLASLLSSLVGGAGSFLFFLAILVAYPQGMGGGDVKLAGVVGLMAGFPGALVAVWIAAVTGGLVAIALLLLRKKGRKDAIPFGPFLSLGGISVLLAGSEIVSRYLDVAGNLTGFWI